MICNTVVEYGIRNPGLLQAVFLDPVFIAPDDEHAWRLYDQLGYFVDLALAEKASPAQFDAAHQPCAVRRAATRNGLCGAQ